MSKTKSVPQRGGQLDPQTPISGQVRAHGAALHRALDHLASASGPIDDIAATMMQTLRNGHKLLAIGNGGSAAEAQHLVTELVGRFRRVRAPYAAIALTTDTAVLTAISNDFGYEQVFARQVMAIGAPGDLLIAFSTSGESPNVLAAAAAARESDIRVVAITAERPSRLERLADRTLRVPAGDTPTAQELHMVVTHLLCDLVETELSDTRSSLEVAAS